MKSLSRLMMKSLSRLIRRKITESHREKQPEVDILEIMSRLAIILLAAALLVSPAIMPFASVIYYICTQEHASTNNKKLENYTYDQRSENHVYDTNFLLTEEQKESLNVELTAFEKRTKFMVSVITMPLNVGEDIDDLAKMYANEYLLDYRVILFVSRHMHQALIKVSPGVRTILTESHANHIRDQVILPRFAGCGSDIQTGYYPLAPQKYDMAQGIIDGTHAIMQTLDASNEANTGYKLLSPARRFVPQ